MKNTSSLRKKIGTYATIDLGTNNCRMLIARPSPHSFTIIDHFSRVTRLGEGLAENNAISHKAVARTIAALKRCAEKLKKQPISQARYIATAACRRAINGKDFIKKVKQETGLSLEIISEKEEARLGVIACVPLLNRTINRTIVFDIGGGSTQISWAHVDGNGVVSIDGFTSIPMGVVTVSEGFFGYDITMKDFKLIASKMQPFLEEFENTHKINGHIKQNAVQMIGTSGTVTTIAAFHLNLQTYIKDAVDGYPLSFEDIIKVQKKMEKMTPQERIRNSCIGQKRADLVMAGFAILDAIISFWEVGEITVADRGLREGVLMDLMQRGTERVKYE